MEKNLWEIIDTKDNFEVSVDGVAIKKISNYKLEATPITRTLTLTIEIPRNNIKVQAGSE